MLERGFSDVFAAVAAYRGNESNCDDILGLIALQDREDAELLQELREKAPAEWS